MSTGFTTIQPKIPPPLDEAFRPASLANHAYRQAAESEGVLLLIGIERSDGKCSRYETRVLPEDHPEAQANLHYAERIFKFLLWQRGGHTAYIGGPSSIAEYILKSYAPGGSREFDYRFMGEQVYERPFTVIPCKPDEVPPANDVGERLGRHFDGYRIGFDLGASDRKVCATADGNVIYCEEVVWEPRKYTDPSQHYTEILTAIQAAASRLPRVDAIGGSSAGILINNRPMVASLFRGVPPGQQEQVRNLFLRLQQELQVPLTVINDGDVAALAGSISLEDNGILGISMGSSQAAGYIDMHGRISGWLNELAFAPIDYNPDAPVDEWSGDRGCGAAYFSQQCVFRLAPRAGIAIPQSLTDAEKLRFVQDKLEQGHAGAVKIWQSIGTTLGYALAHYADFYAIKHVLILGRCTSGSGGSLILDGAQKVLQEEFPQLAIQLAIQLPDEKYRRLGQSIVAASLTPIEKPELEA